MELIIIKLISLNVFTEPEIFANFISQRLLKLFLKNGAISHFTQNVSISDE